MTYEEFINGNIFRTLHGKEDPFNQYAFPLWFDTPDVLLDVIHDYSWIDDLLDWEEEEPRLLDDDDDLRVIAVCDLGFEGCEDEMIDAYAEEFFLVDIVKPGNPVFLWGHDGGPRKVCDSFSEFYARLADFTLPEN